MWIWILFTLFFCGTLSQYYHTNYSFQENGPANIVIRDILIDSKNNTYMVGPSIYPKYSDTMEVVWSETTTWSFNTACFSEDESVIFMAGSRTSMIISVYTDNGTEISRYNNSMTQFWAIVRCGNGFVCASGRYYSDGIPTTTLEVIKLHSGNLSLVWQRTYNQDLIYPKMDYSWNLDRLFLLGAVGNDHFSVAEISSYNGQMLTSSTWPDIFCDNPDLAVTDVAVTDQGIFYTGYGRFKRLDGVNYNCTTRTTMIVGKLSLTNISQHLWSYDKDEQFENWAKSVEIDKNGYAHLFRDKYEVPTKQAELIALDAVTGAVVFSKNVDPSGADQYASSVRINSDGRMSVGVNLVNGDSWSEIIAMTFVPGPSTSPSPSLVVSPSPSPLVSASTSTSPSGTLSNSPSTSSMVSVTPSPDHQAKNRSNSLTVVAVAVPIGAIGVCAVVAGLVFKMKKRGTGRDSELNLPSEEVSLEILTTHKEPLQLSTSSGSYEQLLKKQKSNEIDYSEISIGQELGRGAFGVVYKGRWRNTDCVVKQMDSQKSSDEQARKLFLTETLAVQNIGNHPNVCTVFGVCTNPEYPVGIVMEVCVLVWDFLKRQFVPEGSLEDFLYYGKMDISEKTSLEFGMNIASGMHHLHRENILHCDLAARNLLVSQQEGKIVLKVSDFGLAKVPESDIYNASRSATFPIRWSAPETLRGYKVSRASDVWSFGVVMWEILECKMPYPDKSNTEVINAVCDHGYRLAKPQRISISDELYEVMLQCWSTDPRDRPSFDQIYIMLENLHVQLCQQTSMREQQESHYQEYQPTQQTEKKQYDTRSVDSEHQYNVISTSEGTMSEVGSE